MLKSNLTSGLTLRRGAFVLIAALVSSVVHADDLVALARKEKERRARIAKPVKVLTEDDGKQAGIKGTGSVTALDGPAPTASAGPPLGGQDSAARAAWKTRADSARAAVTEAQKRLSDMERDLATLRSDMTLLAADEAQDPMRLQKRDAKVFEMNKEIAAQKVAIESARKALAAFEEEARQSGVPAGWIR